MDARPDGTSARLIGAFYDTCAPTTVATRLPGADFGPAESVPGMTGTAADVAIDPLTGEPAVIWFDNSGDTFLSERSAG